MFAVVVVVAAAAGGYWFYRQAFPSDQTVIRKNLRELAQSVSFRGEEGGSPLAMLTRANRLLGYFTTDVEIHLADVPELRNRVIQGRDELRELIVGTRGASRSIQVRLLDVYIERIEEGRSTAQVIAGVRIDDQEDEFVQELRLILVKDGDWLIQRVEPVATLKM
jgi:hypothetical protein